MESKNNTSNKSFPFPRLDNVVALLSDSVRFGELQALLKPESEQGEATYFAALVLFKILLIEHDALVAAGRQDLIQKIYVGLYKDLPTITSSVSQGVAEVYMTNRPETRAMYVANCGTGGWKLSYIERTAKGIENMGNQEFEKGDDATSLNQLLVPGVDYGVKKQLYPADVLASMFLANLKSFENANPKNAVKGLSIVALVTGTIRNYAKKNPQHAEAINTEIKKVFNIIRTAGYDIMAHSFEEDRFLMTQVEEGEAEKRAVGSLNRAVDSRANVVSSTGVGKGTTQWLINRADGSSENLDADVGMDGWRNMPVIYHQFKERLQDPVFLADHVKMLEASGDHNVLAFKSGFLISLNPKVAKGTPDEELPRGARAKKLLMNA